MNRNPPPLAASILAAVVAGTYRGGNDLRAIDALVARGLVVVADRPATMADDDRHSHAGRGITVTPAGAAWVAARVSA